MALSTDETLQEVFRAVFDLPAGTEVTKVSQAEQPKWDSLAHVALVAALESEFGVILDVIDSLELTSYEAVRSYLREQGK